MLLLLVILIGFGCRWSVTLEKKKIKIGDKEYDITKMNKESQKIYRQFLYTNRRLSELQNTVKVLNKAKNGYIADIKAEIIKNKTGIDIENLLSSD